MCVRPSLCKNFDVNWQADNEEWKSPGIVEARQETPEALLARELKLTYQERLATASPHEISNGAAGEDAGSQGEETVAVPVGLHRSASWKQHQYSADSTAGYLRCSQW